MEKVTVIGVEGMTCQSCVKTIKTNLTKEKGINSLEVSFRGRGNDMSVMCQNHQDDDSQ